MILDIHFGEGYALEKGHSGKPWKRTRRMVLLSRKGGILCYLVEIDKKRVGSF